MKKIFFSLMFFSVSNMFAMDGAQAKDTISKIEDLRIESFDMNRDAQDILQIIQENRAALIARENFDTDKMLRLMSFNPEDPKKNGSAIFTVARNKTKVVGFVGSQIEDTYLGQFALIAVASEYRKQGIATKLIDVVGTQLMDKGAQMLFAYVRKNHPVGPNLFQKFAKEHNLELDKAEGFLFKPNASDAWHISMTRKDIFLK